MNPLHLIVRRLRALFRKPRLDREMAEEMRAHVELQTQANLNAGMSLDEARYAAQRQFGGVEQIKEIARDQRGWVWLEQLGQDLRYAGRQLARAKGFTAVVVLTLALGIGATTAIFSVVHTVLFNPVPGPDADRMVQIGEQAYMGRETTTTMVGMSPLVLEALQDSSDLFSELAWADISGGSYERKTDDFIASVHGCAVSPNLFRVFGARPLLGRTFAADEAVPLNLETRLPDRDATIVLSYPGWQSLFAGVRDVIGRTIDLSGHRYTVIGVMPAWFQFPESGIQFWVATQPLHLPANRGVAANMRVIVRLKPGVAVAQMQTMLDTLAERLSNEPTLAWRWHRNGAPSGLGLWVRPLGEVLTGANYDRGADDVRRMLFGLMAAIG
ncbi:MAG: ABC transporter permease, partial [Pseudomonadota bacterium]